MRTSKELRWSFSSLGCPELDLPAVVELAKATGIRELELRTIEDRVDLPAVFAERYGTPERLRAWLDGAGVQVAVLDASLKLVGSTAADRAAFLEFMPWAEALGTSCLRVFDGGKPTPVLSDDDLAEAVDAVKWWQAERAANGWAADIVVETHDCLTTSASILRLQSRLEEPVPILWDTHHTWKKAGEAVKDTWKLIRPYVRHVHIKDSISVPSARHPMTYVLPGDGEFDLAGTLALLVEDAYAGIVSLEWERKWHPYLPPMAEALQRARALGWW